MCTKIIQKNISTRNIPPAVILTQEKVKNLAFLTLKVPYREKKPRGKVTNFRR